MGFCGYAVTAVMLNTWSPSVDIYTEKLSRVRRERCGIGVQPFVGFDRI